MNLSAALLAALLALPALPARASVSAQGDWTTGDGYRGWDGNARLDFGTNDKWAMNGSFAWAHSKLVTESLSKQASLGFEHNPDDNWSFRGTITGWKDYLSQVRYIGPSWGFTYLSNEEAKPRRLGVFKGLEEREPGEAIGRGDEAPTESWGLSYDNDLFFYYAPASASSSTVKVGNKSFAVPPSPTAINVVQWHPQLQFEKPLFDELLVPSLSVGHYFYTRNPGVIESRAGQPRFSAAAGSLSALAGGFFKNSGIAALDAQLPWNSRLHASLTAQQSATDNTWAITQELSARTTFADTLSFIGKWDRTIQEGLTSDEYSLGLKLFF